MTEFQTPQIYNVAATVTEVSVPPRQSITLYNTGNITIWVDLRGKQPTGARLHDVRIEPGQTRLVPPLGLKRIFAIARVAGGRLMVTGGGFPQDPQEKAIEQIQRGFQHTAVNDNNVVVYDIAAEFIAVAGGVAVNTVTLVVTDQDAFVRFEATTAALTEPSCFRVLAGESLTLTNLELIHSIQMRNVTPGSNFVVHGIASGN
jgi:hypothetical protein